MIRDLNNLQIHFNSHRRVRRTRRKRVLEGGVFDQSMIDSYIELKQGEIDQVRQDPNPMEFDMYFYL